MIELRPGITGKYRRPGLTPALSFTLFVLLASTGRLLFDSETAQDAWIVFSGVLALVLVVMISRMVRRG